MITRKSVYNIDIIIYEKKLIFMVNLKRFSQCFQDLKHLKLFKYILLIINSIQQIYV